MKSDSSNDLELEQSFWILYTDLMSSTRGSFCKRGKRTGAQEECERMQCCWLWKTEQENMSQGIPRASSIWLRQEK